MSSTSTTPDDDDAHPAPSRLIRNVVVHLHNDQPFMADLLGLPNAADACLICTNVRTMNGTKPVFIDHIESTFLFPLGHVRFVEIPPGADGTVRVLPATRESAAPEPELEIDEDFLRRVREI